MIHKGLLVIIKDDSDLSCYCWRGLLANLVYMVSIIIWWDNHPLLKDKVTRGQRVWVENTK